MPHNMPCLGQGTFGCTHPRWPRWCGLGFICSFVCMHVCSPGAPHLIWKFFNFNACTEPSMLFQACFQALPHHNDSMCAPCSPVAEWHRVLYGHFTFPMRFAATVSLLSSKACAWGVRNCNYCCDNSVTRAYFIVCNIHSLQPCGQVQNPRVATAEKLLLCLHTSKLPVRLRIGSAECTPYKGVLETVRVQQHTACVMISQLQLINTHATVPHVSHGTRAC